MEIFFSGIPKCTHDSVSWLYFLIFVISGYGSVLFAYRWIIIKRVSVVYGYITLVFIGEFIRNGIDFYARVIHICNTSAFDNLSSTKLWSIRLIIILIALSAIVFHMSYRALLQGSDWQHRLNPLHVWCRLRDHGISKSVSAWIIIKYESIINFLKGEIR